MERWKTQVGFAPLWLTDAHEKAIANPLMFSIIWICLNMGCLKIGYGSSSFFPTEWCFIVAKHVVNMSFSDRKPWSPIDFPRQALDLRH